MSLRSASVELGILAGKLGRLGHIPLGKDLEYADVTCSLHKEPIKLQRPFICDNKYACAINVCREMTTTSMAADNPFVDPITSFEEPAHDRAFAIDSTLAAGKNASLTLGTDSLIVLGEFLRQFMGYKESNPGAR
jgi:hypothetical protein